MGVFLVLALRSCVLEVMRWRLSKKRNAKTAIKTPGASSLFLPNPNLS